MTVSEFLGVLRRRKWPFVACVVAGLVGGLAHTALTEKSYRATSRVIVSIPASSDVQEALAGAQLSRSLLETYAAIATSRDVAQEVRAVAGGASGSVEAVAQTNTFLIDISATSAVPEDAAQLANATAEELARKVDDLEAGRSDPVRVAQLDDAVPSSRPVQPVPLRDVVVGLALGLLGGAALVALLEALDRSLKSGAQASAVLGAPVLGSIPRSVGMSAKVLLEEKGALAEAVRAVRTAVRFLDPDQPPRALLVTSANQGEGKTTIATALALSLVRGGESVVLVDADMRKASLTSLVGMERAVGLSSVIVGSVALEDALQEWQSGLMILPAGSTPPNAAELCGSHAMATLVDVLTSRFDTVVVDGPPVLPVTDPVVLSPQVDGVVFVVKHGSTTRAGAAEAARRLGSVGGRILGVVHNGVQQRNSEYYADVYYEASREPTALSDRDRPTTS